MIKKELIDYLSAEHPHLSEKTLKDIVNCILETMSNTLSQGQRIEIRGFGAFSVKTTKERNTRNPKTGETLITLPYKKVHFKPGLELKERVNASKDKTQE